VFSTFGKQCTGAFVELSPDRKGLVFNEAVTFIIQHVLNEFGFND
jgi:hypothetical protein